MIEAFGVSFKNKTELCRAIGFKNTVSATDMRRNYSNSIEQMIRTRLDMQFAAESEIKEALQMAADVYRKEKQAAKQAAKAAANSDALAGPGVVAVQNAIRLSILNASNHTLQMAVAAAGVTFTTDQMRAALQVYSRSFDIMAAARELQKK